MNRYFFFLFIGCFLLSKFLFSQELEADKYFELKGKESAFGTVRHIESRGIGYKRGYSTADGLFFPYKEENSWLLVDVRGHHFVNNEYAGNAGIGVRRFSTSRESVYGVNTYYDYRSDHHRSLHFHQIGVGLEWLQYDFDVRLNGYFPIDRRRQIQHCRFDDFIGDFVMTRYKYKTALTGVNLEVGFPLCRNKYNNFYLALGPYYYDRACKEIFGGKARLEMRLYGYVTLELIASYDHRFKGRVQGQFAITYPKRECKNGLMTKPVERHEIIALDKFCKWNKNF